MKSKFEFGRPEQRQGFKELFDSQRGSSFRRSPSQASLRSLLYSRNPFKSYKTMGLVLIVLLLFGLVTRAMNNFSLGGSFSRVDHSSRNVSFARRYLEYGIMFDAGSTGSRIHVYAFKKNPDGQLILEDELFEHVKPGLSSYAKDPKQGAMTIYNLLQKGKDIIPPNKWHKTPVALKATAGLRLLPKKASKQLLKEVYKVFKDSPFHVSGESSVSIMDGLDEGIFAWVTVNFLIGRFNHGVESLVGALDLGGGSTQITFHPKSEDTITNSPKDFTQKAKVFDQEYELYTHSYLGLGLMSARAAITSHGSKTTDSSGNNNISESPCVSPSHTVNWVFGGKTITVSGHSNYSFDACLDHVKRIINPIDRQDEMNEQTFYTFSYFYDRAVDLNLIDVRKGGIITVGDFIEKTKEVFTSSRVRANKLASMDATYIVALLKYGYGFHNDRKLILQKKINDVEVSWALGATLDMFSKR